MSWHMCQDIDVEFAETVPQIPSPVVLLLGQGAAVRGGPMSLSCTLRCLLEGERPGSQVVPEDLGQLAGVFSRRRIRNDVGRNPIKDRLI
jgi:hypothetical protein